MGKIKKDTFFRLKNLGGTSSFPKIQRDVLFTFFLMVLSLGFMSSIVLAEEKRITEKSPGMAEQLTRKIEDVVAQESQILDNLKVIVYVKTPDLNAVSRNAKERFTPQIEALAGNIREIDKKYRPEESLIKNKNGQMPIKIAISEKDRLRLEDLKEELDLQLDAMRKEVGRALEEAVKPNQKAIKNFIAAKGGIVGSIINLVNAIGVTIPADQLMSIAEHPLILSIVKDRLITPRLDVSVPSVGHDAWWDNDISGGPFDFGIADTGIEEDHPAFYKMDFYHRLGDTVTGDHGTHVAGIVIAGDPSSQNPSAPSYPYLGGAHGLGGPTGMGGVIWANSGNSRATEMTALEWVASGAIQTPEVVNASFGDRVAAIVDYDNYDAFFDAFITHYDTMITVAAGNLYWNDASTTLGHPALAYNILSVASMNDMNTLSRADDVRSDFSSVGPTPENRNKPDICAPGSAIISTNSDYETEADHIPMNGTSMATPHVAAAILLMADGGNHNPVAQKAVLINTADAWNSNNTETTADDTAVDGSHWDKSYGWGYLNMTHALFHRTDYFTGSVVPNNEDSWGFHYILYKGVMDEHEKATLVWEKRAAYKAGEPPDTQYALSDLDLALYNEESGDLVDSATDSANNVHQVAAPVNLASAVIKVSAFSPSFAGATAEFFALATEENLSLVMRPYAIITLTMPESVNVNESFTVTASVRNGSDITSHNNAMTLDPPPGFSVISGDNPQDIGSIGPFITSPTQAAWTVTAPSTAGYYYVSSMNSSFSYGETITDYMGTFISVEEITPCEGDFLGDGDVDDADMSIFIADFGRADCSGDCDGDFMEDNDVDGSDLALFAADFGREDCP